MSTLLIILAIILAVPLYTIIGLGVVAFCESADQPMSDAALWACILLWPIVAVIVLALYILAFGLVIITMLVSVVQQLITKRKEIK